MLSCLIWALLIVGFSLLCGIFQIVAFVFTSSDTFYHLNCWIAFNIWKGLNFILFRLNGTPPSIEISLEGFPNSVNGKEMSEQESAVIISNHVSATDFYLIHEVALKMGMLGQVRYFLKVLLEKNTYSPLGLH